MDHHDRTVKPMEPLLQNGMVDEALLLLFTKIERERDFYTRACRLEGQNSFESIAQGLCGARAAADHSGDAKRQAAKICLAYAGADRGILCTVDVLCADPVDRVRYDDHRQGAH